MRLFLIRHGETVDNIAQLYAGSRDSDLTNHGFQQATRLGRHLHLTGVELSHVFSSHLKRAVQTADLVREAQSSPSTGSKRKRQLEVQQVPLLAEQDFGSLEGVSYIPRPAGSTKSGKASHREIHKDDPEFVPSESLESMTLRTNEFLDQHLFPLLNQSREDVNIAVVSHGILLGVLWRTFLRRLPPKSVTYHPELLASRGNVDLERLGGWSNTGYLELEISLNAPSQKLLIEPPLSINTATTSAAVSSDSDVLSIAPTAVDVPTIENKEPAPIVLADCITTIHAINSRKHLVGLKRTGGGVGSARHDSNQKNIDTFFKRKKVD